MEIYLKDLKRKILQKFSSDVFISFQVTTFISFQNGRQLNFSRNFSS